MAGQSSELTLRTLRRNVALARSVVAAAARRDQPEIVAVEHKRLAWLEWHIAYLEGEAVEYAERD